MSMSSWDFDTFRPHPVCLLQKTLDATLPRRLITKTLVATTLEAANLMLVLPTEKG